MAQERWVSATDGAWSDVTRWSGGIAPGVQDDVVVQGPAEGTDLSIAGTGSAGSLKLSGHVAFSGHVAAGALTVGSAALSGTLDLTGGAAVAATSLTLFADAPGSVTVDSGSMLQIGSAGSGAGPGTIMVDAGGVITGAGSISAVGGIVDNGLLRADGGTLTLRTSVSGSGQVAIGDGATAAFSGVGAPSTVPVTFLGGTGTLEFGTVTYFDGNGIVSALSVQGAVTGFAAGDILQYDGPALTAVRYAAGGNGQGILTLMSGKSIAGRLTLAGSYAGQSFQLAANGDAGSRITLSAPGTASTTMPSAGTTGPDTYVWTGSGAWGTATNWQDTTIGPSPATIAPGANNLVTITGSASSFQTITGPGNAAALTVLGNTALSGVFDSATLTVGNTGTAGAVTLASGTVLTAHIATIANGALQVTGAGLTVSGGLRLGGLRRDASNTSPNLLLVAAGGSARVGGGLDLASVAGVQDMVSVDATSSLEVGMTGGAGIGQITVDAGQVVSGAGTISAAAGIVNNGTILATGGTLVVMGTVSGNGTLQIDTGATLSFGGFGTPSTGAIGFLGTGGTLVVGLSTYLSNGSVSSGLSLQGTISGFAPGDTIHYAGAVQATAVSFQAGRLTFLSRREILGTLSLAGDFSNDTFRLVANGGGGADVVAGINPPADGLVDAAYLLTQHPEIASSGLDPTTWFHQIGWHLGANPDAFFETSYYLHQNPDVAAAGVDPLTHYEQYGWREGHNPSAQFDGDAYLRHNQDVATAGLDPLLHYLTNGHAEGRATYAVPPPSDSLIDAAYLIAHNPEIASSGLDPTTWFHTIGWHLGANPDALFDTSYYLHQNPDVAAAGMDPLTHFEANGWHEGRAPSLLFSPSQYLAANGDVAASGQDPLSHYLSYGQAEGRLAFLPGDTAGMGDPLVDATFYDAQLGATLIPQGLVGQAQAANAYANGGWQHGLNPDAWFDTAYYLSHNPDVAAAGLNPLSHYEQYGWMEGRNPSPAFSTTGYVQHNPDIAAAHIDPLIHYVQYGHAEGRAIYPP